MLELAAGRLYNTSPNTVDQCWADTESKIYRQCLQKADTELGLCSMHYEKIVGELV